MNFWRDPGQVRSHFARFGVEDIVTHYKHTSEEFFARYAEFGLPTIDMAFIDGNHSYAHVQHDVAASLKTLAQERLLPPARHQHLHPRISPPRGREALAALARPTGTRRLSNTSISPSLPAWRWCASSSPKYGNSFRCRRSRSAAVLLLLAAAYPLLALLLVLAESAANDAAGRSLRQSCRRHGGLREAGRGPRADHLLQARQGRLDQRHRPRRPGPGEDPHRHLHEPFRRALQSRPHRRPAGLEQGVSRGGQELAHGIDALALHAPQAFRSMPTARTSCRTIGG